MDRVPKAVKKQIDAYLDQGLVKDHRVKGEKSETCPTVFVRDYIKRAYRYGMLAVAVTFLLPLIANAKWVAAAVTFDKIAIPLLFALIVAYFFYAEYEAKKYKQCTSCQTGNIIGTVAIAFAQWLLLSAVFYFWML